ncbi:MAG: glycoside hydrolase family 13 protein [Bacteroidales bacterium]|nr:glycoside hydrolase family 13 protein [Bacteroidales bacterium]
MRHLKNIFRASFLLPSVFLAACGQAFDPASVADAAENQVERVEPLSWWTGMKTPLQLMVQGPGISSYDISMEGKGVSVKGVHPGDDPDFVFVDVEIAPDAPAGTCWLVFRKGEDSFKYPYLLRERAEGSARRGSFTTADLVYLIMPDRFADGDPTNDNGYSTVAPPYEDGSAVPWRVPQILDTADRSRPLYRHGGDLQGIIDHLDYLADLGVTAVWSTPLLLDNQDYESYHGYACADYYHIDPRFGDNALYRTFVEEAHARGLKVIMDIVTNHCGTAHWWMQKPPFKDWYHTSDPYMQMNALFSVYMDPHASRKDLDRQESGWFVPSMPDMNLDNPFVLKYFQQWAIWWIEYAGLDGLRVDTYPYNEPGPMSQWCKAVTDEYPGMNIVGECWDMNIPQVAYWQKDHPNPNGFNSNLPSIMDFPLQRAMLTALCEDEVNWDEGMTRVYSVIAQDFAYTDLDNMLIFFANHDHARTGDVLRRDPQRMELALAMLATLRGIPQLYYGDEMMFTERPGFGNDGSKRIDFPGGWKGDPVNLFTEEGRAAAGVTEEADYSAASGLHEYTRRLLNWRKGCSVIHHGKTLHFLSRHNEGQRNITDNTYAFFRYDDTDAVFVYINNTAEDRALDWAHYDELVPGPVTGRNVITGREVTLQDGLVVGPRSALIVEFKR